MKETNIIQKKLQQFIRKYYTIQIMQGSIIFITIMLFIFLIISYTEYFLFTSEKVRFLLLFSFVFINSLVAIFLIIIPLLKLLKIINGITYSDAAKIIGNHFAEIKDSLINFLQLNELNVTPHQQQFLQAAINEKIHKLNLFYFNLALNFNFKKYRVYFIIFFIGLIIILFNPKAITQSTYRIIHYNQYFTKPLPYTIIIENNQLQTIQNSDFKLNIKVIGDVVPEKIFIKTQQQQYLCKQLSKTKFEFIFKNLNKNIEFQIKTNDYLSSIYELKVLPKPFISYQKITIQYPAYLQRKSDNIENIGDFVAPAGSVITWNFKTFHTKTLFIQIDTAIYSATPQGPNNFTFSKMFLHSVNYKIFSQSSDFVTSDTLAYNIDIIPDAYPSIAVEEFKDTNALFYSNIYYKGSIEDDYGFSNLRLFYFIDTTSQQNQKPNLHVNDIPFNKQLIKQDFYYNLSLSAFNLQPGQSLSYYFVVCDNDALSKYKCSQSQMFIYKIPTINEIQKQIQNNNQSIKNNLQNTLNNLQKELNNLKNIDKDLISKNTITWQEKKKIEDVINNLLKLQNDINEIKTLYKQAKQNADFINENQEILDKYNQLQELFEKTFNDELRQLLLQYQELLDKMDKNKIQEAVQQLKLTTTDIKNELDRNLNLFKQLELQQNLQSQIDELKRLSEKQQQLAEQQLDKDNKQEQINQQQQINKGFQDFKKQLDNIKNDNANLEEPLPLQNFDNAIQNIELELNNAVQQLQNNNKKSAKSSQQNAGDQMDKLAQDLQQNLDNIQEEEYAEDIATLRQILDNLIAISFKQENLINDNKNIAITDPKFVQLIQNQKNLNTEIQMVKDSLIALSKRQVEIKSVVLKEIEQIDFNAEQTLQFLVNRQKNPAATRQQFVMTHINNLALMLAEALKSLKESQQKNSSCNASGKSKMKCKSQGKGGKPSIATMRQMQKQINEQLSKLQQQMQDAKSKGQGIGKQFNEQLAKLAAQQEALRKQLNELSNQLKGEGNTQIGKELDKLSQQMEQTETELINKMLNLQTLQRQQEIVTRLLESEKALNERDQEEKRESTEGKDDFNRSLPNFDDYFKLHRKNNQDILNKYLPTVNQYYKEKIKQYLYHF